MAMMAMPVFPTMTISPTMEAWGALGKAMPLGPWWDLAVWVDMDMVSLMAPPVLEAALPMATSAATLMIPAPTIGMAVFGASTTMGVTRRGRQMLPCRTMWLQWQA